MTINELRQEMQSYWLSVDAEAKLTKDSTLAITRLHDFYMRLDENDRQMADEIISEWVLSENSTVRFDALALVDDFKIIKSLSYLRILSERLALSSKPEDIYELKKVKRIISNLE